MKWHIQRQRLARCAFVHTPWNACLLGRPFPHSRKESPFMGEHLDSDRAMSYMLWKGCHNLAQGDLKRRTMGSVMWPVTASIWELPTVWHVPEPVRGEEGICGSRGFRPCNELAPDLCGRDRATAEAAVGGCSRLTIFNEQNLS